MQKESQPIDRLLTVKAVADMTTISKATINNYIHSGVLKALRTPSGQFRIRESDARALLEEYRPEEEIKIDIKKIRERVREENRKADEEKKKAEIEKALAEIDALFAENKRICKEKRLKEEEELRKRK